MAGNAEGDDRHDSAANAISAAMQAEAVVVPSVPRIVADDITPEAAGSLMADQHGRLAILSAEGGVFDILAGRYSGERANLDVFLKGHAGDTLKVDRKGRPPEYIPRPALTVSVMIQPAVLVAIAKNGAFSRARAYSPGSCSLSRPRSSGIAEWTCPRSRRRCRLTTTPR